MLRSEGLEFTYLEVITGIPYPYPGKWVRINPIDITTKSVVIRVIQDAVDPTFQFGTGAWRQHVRSY